MIYYYKHKSLDELSQTELDMLGYDGVIRYAMEHDMPADELFLTIKKLERDVKELNAKSLDVSSGEYLDQLNFWLDRYVDYFNNGAKHDRQAYIVIGNVASGKSTFSQKLEQETQSIIVDSDRYKTGEHTPAGFFEGFSSIYTPLTRDAIQEPCSIAGKKTLDLVSDEGLNLILPKASTSADKLEKQLKILENKNYDIHLILIEAPTEECANRNYFRYLIREYAQEINPNGKTSHGRFIPVSVVIDRGDKSFTTFAHAYGRKRYKSYKAFYNDKTTPFEELDLETMQMNV